MADLLLIETSLDAFLVPYDKRRTQVELFAEFLRIQQQGQVFHEHVHSQAGLRAVFEQCKKQNNMQRAGGRNGARIEATEIRFVHISSHGDSESLYFPLDDQEGQQASPFEALQGFGVSVVFLSACNTGRAEDLAQIIIKEGGAKVVVGYVSGAHDHVCAMAEQMFYYQLIGKGNLHLRSIRDAVRRVNDALFLLGEKEERFLSCWLKTEEQGKIEGPFPWWTEEVRYKNKHKRSFLSELANLFGGSGKARDEDVAHARRILKHL